MRNSQETFFLSKFSRSNRQGRDVKWWNSAIYHTGALAVLQARASFTPMQIRLIPTRFLVFTTEANGGRSVFWLCFL